MPMDKKTHKILVRGSVSRKELQEKEDEQKIRKSLHYANVDGILSSASSSILGSFLTPFALFLKATAGEIGLLNSVANLSHTVSQVPGAKATEFYSRKSIWLFARLVSRFLFVIPLVLLPFLNLQNPVFWLIIISIFIYFFLGLSFPSWSSLMGDLVPMQIRGRYFGRRNMLMGISGIAATIAAGYLLSLYGFSVIFMLFAALGLLSIPFFMRMYEPPLAKVYHYRHRFALKPSRWMSAVRTNRGLAIFTVYLVLVNLAVNVAAPFYAVYMLRELHIDYTTFALLITLGALARIVSFKYWGRLNDWFGSRKTFLVTAVLGIFTPFLWLWVGDAFTVGLVMIFDGLVWSGFDLVAFDYLLDITPADKRPQYVANHTFFVGIGAVIGSLAGAVLANSFEGQSFLIFRGLQMVFLFSFVIRIFFLAILPKIPEIDIAHSKLVPVRYVFWHAVAVEPMRGIQHAISYSFRYPYDIEKQFKKELSRIRYRVRMFSV